MLSENIRKYRKANQMSQDELAEKLRVTRQSISLWETGQTQPSLDNIVALASLFHISTDTLLTGEDSGPARVMQGISPSPEKKKNPVLAIVIVLAVILVGLLIAVLLWKPATDDRDDRSGKETAAAEQTDPEETDAPTVKPEIKKDLYGYLKAFVVEKGTINGDYSCYTKTADNYGGYSSEDFTLYYWGDTDTVEFCLHSVMDETFSVNFYLRVPKTHTGTYEYISSYYYRDTGAPLYEARGTIDAALFTQNYPLTCTDYTGSADVQNEFMEMSRQGICDLIACLEEFTVVEGLEYSFADFGFEKF